MKDALLTNGAGVDNPLKDVTSNDCAARPLEYPLEKEFLNPNNGAGVELYETDLNGAAVVENELSNTNGAGVDEAKLLTPNEYADGLANGKLAF